MRSITILFSILTTQFLFAQRVELEFGSISSDEIKHDQL